MQTTLTLSLPLACVRGFEYRGRSFVFDGNSLLLAEVSPDLRAAVELATVEDDKGFLGQIESSLGQKGARRLLGMLACMHEAGFFRGIDDAQFDTEAHERMLRDLETPTLTGLQLAIAASCNLRCVYCYADQGSFNGTSKASFMSLTTARAVMGMVLQRCRKRWLWVGFLGGEPLLHPEFDLLLRLIQASADDAGVKLRLVLSTNGTIFDRHLAGLLAEYRVHTSVSLDGPEKVQDMQRPYASGAGSYSIVLQNTKRFIDVCGPELISVRVTLTPFNVSHRRVIAAKVRKALGHHVSFDFEPVTVEGSHAFSWSKPALEEYRRTEREAFEDSMSEMEPALRADPTRIHAALLENRLYKRVRLATLCEFGVNQVAVTADGDVYPCIGVVGCHSLRMGNVSEGGLQMSGTVRDLFINRIVTRMPHCRQCWAKYLCGGGCAAAIKRYCGSFLTRSEEMCVFRKSRAESSIFRFINLLDLYASRLGAGGTFN